MGRICSTERCESGYSKRPQGRCPRWAVGSNPTLSAMQHRRVSRIFCGNRPGFWVIPDGGGSQWIRMRLIPKPECNGNLRDHFAPSEPMRILLSSRSHSTELATRAQYIQSMGLKLTVEKAC